MTEREHAGDVRDGAARERASVERPEGGAAESPQLLQHSGLRGRGNAAARAAVFQQLQRASGNRAVRRSLDASGGAPVQAAPTDELQVQRDDTPATTEAPSTTGERSETNAPPAAPTEDYVVPFDRNPLSLPGEEILFNDVFRHADPTLFQLAFTGVGGTFDSAKGSASKTIAGLNSGNLPFFIDKNWDGKSAVSVTLRVKRVADNVAVRTYTWTFAKKVNIPTTIDQQETEGERPLPSTYSYKVGPDVGGDGKADYVHETILEEFGSNTCNITMADLKPAWKTAHAAITTDAALTTYFFGGSGSNGTFTVDENDKIYDQHGGGMPDKATFEDALTTMKEIYVDLPQTYTAKPGTPLGTYTIRRILKLDGTKHLKKMKK